MLVLCTFSDISATATLMSEEELSDTPEFFLDLGSGADSQGHTSSEVDAPAAAFGFLALYKLGVQSRRKC